MDKVWWHRQCDFVLHNGFIFSESIAKVIVFDNGDIGKERLLK